ncbi:MAG TPA: rRNA maturation RNase YbeY [bacterium]|nr:rRNA maturation RNase YbeY [bacterium]
MLDLDIQYPDSEGGDEGVYDPSSELPSPEQFTRWVAETVGAAPTAMTLRLAHLHEAAQLNMKFRGKDYATNVLSFPLEFPEETGIPYIGDIVICPDVVAREAAEQHKPLLAHYAHLTVHGVLHLLGYDHENESDADEMETLETQILATLGFPDPYQPIEALP